MVNSCGACTKTIRSTQSIKCSKCANHFHSICVNISDFRKLSEDTKLNWACPLCLSKEPKTDNSNTPIRTSAAIKLHSDESACARPTASDGRNLNVPLAESAPASAPCSPIEAESLGALALEIKLLRSDVGEIKSHMQSLTEHITQCTSRLDEYGHRLSFTEEKIRKLEERETEVTLLKNTVGQLKEQLNSQAQAGLRNEVELVGVTEFTDENPVHLVLVVARKLGVTLDEYDLDYVMRVGPRHSAPKNAPIGQQSQSLNMHPRPIVARFIRRAKRDEFLRAGKLRRNFTCEDIGVTDSKSNVYINERLTQDNRQLFRMARARAKEADFKFCWIKNGTIHVRKQEGNPAVTVKTPEDIQRHLTS